MNASIAASEDFRVAAVRADLRHEEHLATAAGERLAHAHFTLALVILPRVVHERDAGVDRRMDDADRFTLGPDGDEMKSAEPQRGDEFAGSPERSARDVDGCGHGNSVVYGCREVSPVLQDGGSRTLARAAPSLHPVAPPAGPR